MSFGSQVGHGVAGKGFTLSQSGLSDLHTALYTALMELIVIWHGRAGARRRYTARSRRNGIFLHPGIYGFWGVAGSTPSE